MIKADNDNMGLKLFIVQLYVDDNPHIIKVEASSSESARELVESKYIGRQFLFIGVTEVPPRSNESEPS